MWGLRYLTAYAIGTVVGVFNEYFQKPEQKCYASPDMSCTLTCAATNVYGWSIMGLTACFDAARHYKIPELAIVLMIGPVLTAFEAICGAISGWYFKEQRWCYPKNYVPACNGYISLVSSLYFAVGGTLFYYCIYKPFLAKI